MEFDHSVPETFPLETGATRPMSRNYLGALLRRPSTLVDLSPGDRVGRYRIVECLGEGGMGCVYRAEQSEPVRRPVALKVIKLGMDTREVIARFEVERQALALLNHANVAAVLDAGATESGRPYFVMEYVRGQPLTEYCDAHRLGLEQRLRLFVQACQGIQHAHQKGIIHRDIKPGNVLVAEADGDAVVKVIDFGVAKSTGQKLSEHTLCTRLGTFVGTPNYTSPEQARLTLADVDTRTDVYSLGVMLYEVLVGTLPFDPGTFSGKPMEEIQRIIRESEPPTPTLRFDSLGPGRAAVARNRDIDQGGLRRRLRGDIAWIALKAMEKDRNRRYPSALALADDVGRYLAGEPVLARPPSATYRLGKFVRRHVVGVSLAAAILIGLTVTASAMTSLYLQARKAESVAQQEAESARQVARFLGDLFSEADPNRSAGRELSARELLDRGARRIGRELDDQPVVKGGLMRTISGIYEELGLYEPALALGRQALALHERTLAPDDPELALGLANLGNILESLGDYAGAMAHFARALAIDEAAFGPDHPRVAETLSDLGGILEQSGRYPEALEYIKRALRIDRRHFGPLHPRIASDLNDLGNVHEAAGDDRLALSHYREALSVAERTLAPGHPDLSGFFSDLGSVLVSLERFDEAESYFRRALALAEPAFGPDHPDVAEALAGLGEALEEQGREAEAKALLTRALAIFRAHFGDDHEDTIEVAEAVAELGADEEDD